jgi:hypothetical protein
VLGVVAIVVVGLIVYFVCKGKRKNISLQHQQTINTFTNEKSNNVNESEVKKLDTSTNKESNNVNVFEVKKIENEPKLKPEVGKKVEELYKRLESIKVDVSNVWTLEKLRIIFQKSSDLVLETLLKKSDKELKTLWFCDKNANSVVNMYTLFDEEYESVFKKFFEGDLKSEKRELFSLLINTGRRNLESLLYLFDALNRNSFDKIYLTTEIAKILLQNPSFTNIIADEEEDRGGVINFTAAILTGKFKEDQTSFEVNIENLKTQKGCECISFSYKFENSPVGNLKALLSKYEEVSDYRLRFNFLLGVVSEYNIWVSEQQKQEYLNENKVNA